MVWLLVWSIMYGYIVTIAHNNYVSEGRNEALCKNSLCISDISKCTHDCVIGQFVKQF